jgi:hypothetical protein
MTICANCEKEIVGSVFRGEEGTFLVFRPLCSSCFNDDDPFLTIVLVDDIEHRLSITRARNHTGGQFLLGAHETLGSQLRSNAYARVYSSALWKTEELSNDTLRELDKEIRRTFKEKNIVYAKVFVGSPKEHYKDYELWVKSEDISQAIPIINDALAKTQINIAA